MAVNFTCDWCNKTMGSVPVSKMKDFIQEHGEICKECIEKKKSLEDRIENFKKHWDMEFNKFRQNAQEDLAREIREISGSSL